MNKKLSHFEKIVLESLGFALEYICKNYESCDKCSHKNNNCLRNYIYEINCLLETDENN